MATSALATPRSTSNAASRRRQLLRTGRVISTRKRILMSAEEKILTLHPKGKSGVNISRRKYEILKREILETLSENPLPFQKMADVIEKRIGASFDGSVSWYAITVKLDLEARGLIRAVPGTRPVRFEPDLTAGMESS